MKKKKKNILYNIQMSSNFSTVWWQQLLSYKLCRGATGEHNYWRLGLIDSEAQCSLDLLGH